MDAMKDLCLFPKPIADMSIVELKKARAVVAAQITRMEQAQAALTHSDMASDGNAESMQTLGEYTFTLDMLLAKLIQHRNEIEHQEKLRRIGLWEKATYDQESKEENLIAKIKTSMTQHDSNAKTQLKEATKAARDRNAKDMQQHYQSLEIIEQNYTDKVHKVYGKIQNDDQRLEERKRVDAEKRRERYQKFLEKEEKLMSRMDANEKRRAQALESKNKAAAQTESMTKSILSAAPGLTAIANGGGGGATAGAGKRTSDEKSRGAAMHHQSRASTSLGSLVVNKSHGPPGASTRSQSPPPPPASLSTNQQHRLSQGGSPTTEPQVSASFQRLTKPKPVFDYDAAAKRDAELQTKYNNALQHKKSVSKHVKSIRALREQSHNQNYLAVLNDKLYTIAETQQRSRQEDSRLAGLKKMQSEQMEILSHERFAKQRKAQEKAYNPPPPPDRWGDRAKGILSSVCSELLTMSSGEGFATSHHPPRHGTVMEGAKAPPKGFER